MSIIGDFFIKYLCCFCDNVEPEEAQIQIGDQHIQAGPYQPFHDAAIVAANIQALPALIVPNIDHPILPTIPVQDVDVINPLHRPADFDVTWPVEDVLQIGPVTHQEIVLPVIQPVIFQAVIQQNMTEASHAPGGYGTFFGAIIAGVNAVRNSEHQLEEDAAQALWRLSVAAAYHDDDLIEFVEQPQDTAQLDAVGIITAPSAVLSIFNSK